MLRLPHRSSLLTLVAVTLAVGLIAGSAGAAGPAVSPQELADTSTVTGGNLTDGNTTTPHEDPETVGEDGDTEQIAAHLSGRLGTLLEGSSRNISAAEYDQARSLVGDEYDDVLNQYVTVAGETGQEDSAETFANIQNDTAELIALREEFETTRAEYEEAVAEGDTQRARQLARELARLAEEIDGVAVQLDRDLNSVENATGSDLDAVQNDVETVQLETTATANETTQAELTTTNITATATPSTFSFQNATQVTGTLRTANGTPISNEVVTIQVGERSYDVETDAAGNYTLTYQPVFLPANATSVPVAFQPADTSPYLGANTTTPARVTDQTATTLTVTNESITGNYQTPIQATGTVTLGDNATVAGVPVVLLLDGQQIDAGETQADGQVTLTGSVPAEVAEGAAPLELQVPLTGTAVTGSNTTTTADITSVETQLSVDATVAEATEDTPREAVLTGNFTLTDGSPVAGQSLGVFVGDRQIETVTTAADGSYQTTVAASEFSDETDAPTVRVAYTGSETHLAASESTVTLDTLAQTTSSEGLGVSLRQLAVGGGGLLGIILILVARVTGWTPLNSGESTASAPTDAVEPAAVSSGKPSVETTRSQQLLDDAFTALAAENTTAAVQLAYGSLRAAFQTQVDSSEPTTHWEFYNRCQEAGVESLADIKTVITAYEMATFAQPVVSTERAREVLEQVADVIGHGEQTTADAQPTDD